MDVFGSSVASLGDHDGDGIGDLAVGAPVGAPRDDPEINDRGTVWILFLNIDGTVKSHQKITDAEGGFTGALDDRDSFGRSVSSLAQVEQLEVSSGLFDSAIAVFCQEF